MVVATDDERIASAVRGFGGEAQMTSPDCASGTDRVAEAARGLSEEIILNLQGDEPMMDPSVIDAVAGPLLADPTVMMATAAIVQENPEEFVRPSVVNLYFSRAPIPHFRDTGCGRYRKHLGIYGYRRDFLLRLSALPPSPLEEAECLEQLRVLQSGGKIRVVDVTFDSVGVDTPEDLQAVETRICARKER
jgi:3-deoxy-manno-octulosonate cytidylyltransferase (CMP-KDO synthetase)